MIEINDAPAKHTPGPFAANGTLVVEAQSGMCFHVAYCHLPDAGNPTTGMPLTDRAEANALLFAAAPELLAACEAAVWEDNGMMCTQQLAAAIAKARGEGADGAQTT